MSGKNDTNFLSLSSLYRKAIRMTIDDESCRKSATAIAAEFQTHHPDIDAQLLEDIEKLTVKHMLPVIMAVRAASASKTAKSKSKSTVTKGSSRPNYYAWFHSLCSSKSTPYLWAVQDYIFRFQPNLDKLDGRQKEEYDKLMLPENADKLAVVQSFQITGDLPAVVKFVGEQFSLVQMVCTSMIWNHFLSKEDRDRFAAWYKQTLKDEGEIPSKIICPKLVAPSTKINPCIRKSLLRNTVQCVAKTVDEPTDDSEPEPVVEPEPAVEPVVESEPVVEPAPKTKHTPAPLRSVKSRTVLQLDSSKSMLNNKKQIIK